MLSSCNGINVLEWNKPNGRGGGKEEREKGW
jgi:hypothetical protein